MWLIICFAVIFVLTRSLYRLFLHPLSAIPGPKLAAITHLHEFYHDAIRGGMFIWEIEKMHRNYGNSNHRDLMMK